MLFVSFCSSSHISSGSSLYAMKFIYQTNMDDNKTSTKWEREKKWIFLRYIIIQYRLTIYANIAKDVGSKLSHSITSKWTARHVSDCISQRSVTTDSCFRRDKLAAHGSAIRTANQKKKESNKKFGCTRVTRDFPTCSATVFLLGFCQKSGSVFSLTLYSYICLSPRLV